MQPQLHSQPLLQRPPTLWAASPRLTAPRVNVAGVHERHERCANPASTSAAPICRTAALPPTGHHAERGDRPWVRRASRRRVQCGAAMNDPADVIPSPYGDDEEDEEGRVDPATQHVAVVGGGPSGLLSAIYLARRGYNVEVFERDAAPGVDAKWRQANYPMLLSSRAMVAFRELKLETAYNGPQAPLLQGTWDVTSGRMQEAQPDDEHLRSVLVDRSGLLQALATEARRLYPSKIRINYETELVALDVASRQATVVSQQPTAGATQLCSADRARVGASLSASCVRPPNAAAAQAAITAATAAAGIPMWDTAALQSAGLAPRSGAGGRPGGAAAVLLARRVQYDLLVGADGSDSKVRELMLTSKPKVRNFEVQLPNVDQEMFRGFTGLRQADGAGAGSELVPGFGSHGTRQYLYQLTAPTGSARLELWVSEQGVVSGIAIMPPGFDWAGGAGAVRQALASAPYASRLPAAWLEAIVQQVADPRGPAPKPLGRTVQVSQFHGPKLVLMGDAAHGMTNETRQGLNCAVETVRLMNVVLKISGDNINRVGNVLTELRGEDAHCVQMMEGMQRSLRPGLAHGDFMFAVASWLGRVIWRAAAFMSALMAAIAPAAGFRAVWVPAALADCRKGYGEVLKVLTRFAALPIIVVLSVTAFLLRGPIMAMVRGALST